jgi:hypothetical protein
MRAMALPAMALPAMGLVALVALAAAGAVGCDDEPEPRPEPQAPASPECRANGARVARAFERFEDSGEPLFTGVDPAPSSARGTEIVRMLPRLLVAHDRILLDGVEIRGESAPESIAAEMEMRASLWGSGPQAQLHGPVAGAWPNATLLYVPNGTSLRALRIALGALEPTLRYDLLVQHAEEPDEPPNPPPWLSAELARIGQERDLEARRARFRTVFDRATGDCVAARAHTPFLFGRDPAVPAQAEPTGTLADALRACRCDGVDVVAMVAIGILTGPPNRHPLRRLSFTRVTEPTEGAITTEDELTVEWLVTQLERAGPSARVHFAP